VVTLPPSERTTIEPLLATLEPIQVQLASVEQRLEQLCGTEPVVNRLMTTPGVDPIVAASFVSVVDEARRFHGAHQVECYLGLVPSEDTTGGKRRLGAITKRGNSYLRAPLVQAAWIILRLPGRTNALQRWALRIAERRGKRIAVIALARRLAGVLWAMWRDGTAPRARQHSGQIGGG
jgi:transposase